MFSLYRTFTDLSAWPLRLVLRVRGWRGKEEPLRLRERRGITQAVRPTGNLVWCHAASVGEAVAFLPVIDRLSGQDETSVILTTGTVSSARLMAERLPNQVIHQFAPWDRRAWVARFLNHWQPQMAVRMESELWPNTLSALKDGDVPTVVVNGRLSEKSARGWRRFSQFASDVFGCLNLVVAQTAAHADRFKNLGARQVEVANNLKLACPALPVDQKALAALKSMIGERPVWLAASTHPGEDDIALKVHKKVAQHVPDLLTIIVPRHAHRGSDIAGKARGLGLSMAQKSIGARVIASTEVYIADTFGELGTFFSHCPVVFMGKSLTVGGGQNPIEPIHFGCAVLFGPNMDNFADLAAHMLANGMAIEVKDKDDLAHHVQSLLQNPDTCATLAAAAHKLLDSGQESLDKTVSLLTHTLENTAKARHPNDDGR